MVISLTPCEFPYIMNPCEFRKLLVTCGMVFSLELTYDHFGVSHPHCEVARDAETVYFVQYSMLAYYYISV